MAYKHKVVFFGLAVNAYKGITNGAVCVSLSAPTDIGKSFFKKIRNEVLTVGTVRSAVDINEVLEFLQIVL